MDIQELNLRELKEFRKEKEKEICCICGDKVFGFARTMPLCKKHYKKVVKENKKYILGGIEITTDVSLIN